MSESSKGDVEAAISAVEGLVKAVPIYQDLAQPALKEVGQALQTVAKIVHILVAPFNALVWGYDQFSTFLETKVAPRLANIPIEAIRTPPVNVEVDSFNGLLVDFATAKQASLIVRGIRAASDYETELQMALMNHRLQPKLETVFLMSGFNRKKPD